MSRRRVSVELNGVAYEPMVDPRLLLSDFIRHEARLTGTHVGCEHGVCGSCTVQLDGQPVRSCLLLAVQANGHSVRTVEALESDTGEMHPIQRALKRTRAVQCGFCTPGFLMTIEAFLREADLAELDEAAVRHALSGNLCRCGGYQSVVAAVLLVAEEMSRLRLLEKAGAHPWPEGPDTPTGREHGT